MTKKVKIFYSVLSGILLSSGWIDGFTGMFLLIGFLPLLYVEHAISEDKTVVKTNKQVFKYAFLSFAVWNILTTWWIKNASFPGFILAVLVTSLLMSVTFLLFHIMKKRLGAGMGYFSFIIFWIIYEYIYIHGEISWPWLTLGYGLSNDIKLVQWYEFTGSLGGSLWILLANAVLFNGVLTYVKYKRLNKTLFHVISFLLIVFVPIIISLGIFKNYNEKEDPYKIVAIQHNIDPYQKFIAIESMEQTNLLLRIADSIADQDVDYFVAPETAINNHIWIGAMMNVSDIKMVKNFVQRYPGSKFVVGITCYQRYDSSETETCQPIGNTGYYYDSYNSAIQIDTTDEIQIYHKSKLVVGVEKMPYPQLFKFLRPLTLKLGGTFRSHATQKERTNLISPQDSLSIAPVICWENVFGEYVGEYVKKGAELIFVVTNEGWWGDTPGHRQLNRLSQLRAIETRRSIARSANTGVSSFINQKGEVLDKLTWWKRGALKGELNANTKITFYVKQGDYIASISKFFGLIVLAYFLVNYLMSRSKREKKNNS